MENASKALIIAGAILLSIVIISLGLVVVNNTRQTINDANTDAQAIQAYNSQWEAYVGANKTANDVKALITAVNAQNITEQKTGNARYIAIKPNNPATATKTPTTKPASSAIPTNLVASKNYTINVTYDSTTGFVCEVGYK